MVLALMKQLVALLLLVLLLIETVAARHVVQVSITNDISPGTSITVHCKSKNDDIGSHILAYKDVLGFSFRPNIWGTTDYYCYFFWGRTKQAKFDVFKEGMCANCTWYAQKEFICLLNQGGKYFNKKLSFGPVPFKNFCQSWIGKNPPALKANGTTGDIVS